MNQKLRKRNEEKKDRKLYDSFWEEQEFKPKVELQAPKPKVRIPQPMLTLEELCGYETVQEGTYERFSKNAMMEKTNFDSPSLGAATQKLFDSIISKHSSQETSYSKTELEDLYRHNLGRFLLLNKTIGWDKKYRPFKSIEVLSQTPMSAIKQWIKDFFEHRVERLLDQSEGTGSGRKSNSQQPPINHSFRISQEEDTMTKLPKIYSSLLLVSKPGIGKTSCLEAVCQSECYSMQSIDCSLYEHFNDIKKKYSEAVKSKVVEVDNSTNISNQPKATGSLMNFFSQAKQQNSEPNTARTKKQEKKVFVLHNFEYLLRPKPDSPDNFIEKVVNSMLDFFDFSSFPFIIETSKSGRNMIDHSLLSRFDIIDYTRPEVSKTSEHFYCIFRIEALNRLDKVKDIKKYKEQEQIQPGGYQSMLEEAYIKLENALQSYSNEDIDRVLDTGPTLEQISDFISVVDTNLHKISSTLSYISSYGEGHSAQDWLNNALLYLINKDNIDEYKLMPQVNNKPMLLNTDLSIISAFPSVSSAFAFKTVEECSFFSRNMLIYGVAQRLELDDRILRNVGNVLLAQENYEFDVLEAQEDIYLSELDKKVNAGLLRCGLKPKVPEEIDYYRILSKAALKDSGQNPFGLRSKPKNQNHLRKFLEIEDCMKIDPSLHKNLLKRLLDRKPEDN